MPPSPKLWPATGVAPDVDTAQCRWRGELPCCPHCGALARPNILMFEDWGWNPARREWKASARRPADPHQPARG